MSSKWKVLLAMLAGDVVIGVALAFAEGMPEASAPIFALTLLTSFFPFAWYRLDSDERGYRRTWLLNVAIIGFAVLGFPYYFVRSRGILRGVLATAAAFAFVLLSLIVNATSALIVFAARGQLALPAS